MAVANHSAWAEIDLKALAHNFHAVRPAGPARSVIAVVKADAYGHGAVEASRTLLREGAAMLAVATVAEGAALRSAGISAPILLMGAFPRQDIQDIIEQRLTASVSSPQFAAELDRAAERLRHRVAVHVKVDTGMGRLGIPAAAAIPAIEKMSFLPNLFLEGIYTHFPSADEEDKSFTLRQVADFDRIVTTLDRMGVTFRYHHTAASAACLDVPESIFDTVRPGIALYGLRPSGTCGNGAKLKPVMEFCARVVHVEQRPAGCTVGYGRACRLGKATVVAVVSAGYADGYDRRLSGRGVVTIRGRAAPVLGRVSMDMISVDVSGIGDVHPGEKAILFSADPKAPNCVERVAREIDTIPYCVICGVSARVQRVYN